MVETQAGVTLVTNDVVEIAFSGKAVGNVDPRFPAEDLEANRQKLLRTLGVGKYTVQVCQMGSEFIDLSDTATKDIKPTYNTDGMFVNRTDVVLGLNPADCVAITMFDARHPSVIGLIHAGRQGVSGDIHLSALEHLTKAHRVPKEQVGMVFGPS
ncbi:MAG: laccase domain-containing protein, partial [Pseudomonadota bacterium]